MVIVSATFTSLPEMARTVIEFVGAVRYKREVTFPADRQPGWLLANRHSADVLRRAANQVDRALISMVARSNELLQSEAGYIDARPTTRMANSLATHGRTIHVGHEWPFAPAFRHARTILLSGPHHETLIRRQSNTSAIPLIPTAN